MAQPFISGYQGEFNAAIDAVIASSGTKTAAIDLGGLVLCGVIFPTTFTGTALTFEVSDAIDGTFVPLKSTVSGTALSYTIVQASYAAIDPKDFQGVRFLKLVSGSIESGARTIKLAARGF